MSSLDLPSPPPAGGETTGRSVVDVVTDQHRALTALCDRLTDAGADRRGVVDVVVATLSRHLSAEERYLYPAVRRAVPEGDLLADRELAEDHELLLTLRRLDGARPADPAFEALAADVAAAVRRHVEADAAELLPLLEQMVPVEDLIRVGDRIATAAEAAPTRPHPGTPSRPPWNKVVDPVVAVVDRARDAMSRRTTSSDDL